MILNYSDYDNIEENISHETVTSELKIQVICQYFMHDR